MPQLDVARFKGLKPSVLLDLICLTGVLEEEENHISRRAPKKSKSESSQRSELEKRLDEDIARVMMGEDGCPEAVTVLDSLETTTIPAEDKVTKKDCLTASKENVNEHEGNLNSQANSRTDLFSSELRAVQVSYLLLGALKSLAVILSCGKFADMLLIPKLEASSQNQPETTKALISVENRELRSVLQFLVRSMVKWAVRTCPIKQVVSLSDLERAQIMIFKGALNMLQEDSGTTDHQKGTDFFQYIQFIVDVCPPILL